MTTLKGSSSKTMSTKVTLGVLKTPPIHYCLRVKNCYSYNWRILSVANYALCCRRMSPDTIQEYMTLGRSFEASDWHTEWHLVDTWWRFMVAFVLALVPVMMNTSSAKSKKAQRRWTHGRCLRTILKANGRNEIGLPNFTPSLTQNSIKGVVIIERIVSKNRSYTTQKRST